MKREIMVKTSIVGLSSNQSTSKWWNQSEIWREWMHTVNCTVSCWWSQNKNIPIWTAILYLLASQVVLFRCWNNTSLLPQSDHIKSQTGDLWKPCGSEWLSHGNWWTGCWQSLKPIHLFSLFGHSLQSIGVENDYAPSRHQVISKTGKNITTTQASSSQI